jgi:hypothetical protein
LQDDKPSSSGRLQRKVASYEAVKSFGTPQPLC